VGGKYPRKWGGKKIRPWCKKKPSHDARKEKASPSYQKKQGNEKRGCVNLKKKRETGRKSADPGGRKRGGGGNWTMRPREPRGKKKTGGRLNCPKKKYCGKKKKAQADGRSAND